MMTYNEFRKIHTGISASALKLAWADYTAIESVSAAALGLVLPESTTAAAPAEKSAPATSADLIITSAPGMDLILSTPDVPAAAPVEPIVYAMVNGDWQATARKPDGRTAKFTGSRHLDVKTQAKAWLES